MVTAMRIKRATATVLRATLQAEEFSMIKLLVLLVVVMCPSVVPVTADDPAQANQLMVEAAKLIKAAEKEQVAPKKLALLERALANLNEIIEHHPSSSLAVKLITDQPIGSLSLVNLTDMIEELKAKASQKESSNTALDEAGKDAENRLRLAAVSEETNFLLEMDLNRLANTAFWKEAKDRWASEVESYGMEALFGYLQDAEHVVLAADLTHIGQDVDLFARRAVIQLTLEKGFDLAVLKQALGTLRLETGELSVNEMASPPYLGYEVSFSGDSSRPEVQSFRFFVLPSPAAEVLFVGLQFEPLLSAMERYVSGELIEPRRLLRPRRPESQLSLSAAFPRSMRDGLKSLQLLEQYSYVHKLPLPEILGAVLDISHVLVEVAIDRHVTLELVLEMYTAFGANGFFAIAKALVLPALILLNEGLFVSDPLLEQQDLQLRLRFRLDDETLLEWFGAFLSDYAPTK